ncbi:MAG: hypothetical protein KGL26_11125 [Pseudomonadota bacterium]|nr:hypothetical protein [Pseudomonadota bacterium]
MNKALAIPGPPADRIRPSATHFVRVHSGIGEVAVEEGLLRRLILDILTDRRIVP